MSAIPPVSSDAAMRTLALRLIGPRYIGDVPVETMRLLVGALPDDLPVAVPIPTGSQIIGSVVGPQKQSIMVLDSDLETDRVFAFYREHLEHDGWTLLERTRVLGGFLPASVTNHLIFCRGPRGPSLRVQAERRQLALTEVHLHLGTDPRYTPCTQRQDPDRTPLIPDLLPPAGARQRDECAGYPPEHATATVETELDLEALARHYAQQLVRAGWTRRSGARTGPLAWSTWLLPGVASAGLHGVMYVLARPEVARQYALEVRAQADEDTSPAHRVLN